jgi:hypothetical protein
MGGSTRPPGKTSPRLGDGRVGRPVRMQRPSTFRWLRAAGVLVSSSGAAEQGSPMSGGYGGAKWMLRLMAKYANGLSEQKGLGISFQAIVPRQMIAGTGVGGAGSKAYARLWGSSRSLPGALPGNVTASVRRLRCSSPWRYHLRSGRGSGDPGRYGRHCSGRAGSLSKGRECAAANRESLSP